VNKSDKSGRGFQKAFDDLAKKVFMLRNCWVRQFTIRNVATITAILWRSPPSSLPWDTFNDWGRTFGKIMITVFNEFRLHKWCMHSILDYVFVLNIMNRCSKND
jgi:hypothetical protein